MGFAPEVFAAMTPAEFCYAWLGWAHREERIARQAWERERWSVWVLTSLQLDRKDRRPMCEMFPLPWEHTAEQMTPTPSAELTQEERQKRINELLQCIKQDKQ